jgi:PST family polysaccharide transporter
LARLVEPTAFGLIALAQVYLVLVQAICDQGVTTALIQRDILEEAHKDSVFWASVAISILLMGCTIGFAGHLSRLYGVPGLAPVLRWYALVPLLAALSMVQNALARRELRFKALALRQMIASLVGGVVGVAMALGGRGIWALVAQGLTTQAVGVVILWSIVDWRPRLAFSFRHFRDLFSFGFNVLVTDIVYFIGGQADRLLLGYFLGAADLGYYSVAQRFIRIIADTVGGSSEGIVVPLFSRIQNDKSRVARGLVTAQSLLTITVIPAFVGLAAIAPALLRLALGDRWEPSIAPTQALALASLAYWLAFFFGHVITALGRPTLRLFIVFLRSVSQLIAVAVGVRYGVVGVAWGVAITQIVFYGIELAALRRTVQFSVPAYLTMALKPALAAIAMAAIVIYAERLSTTLDAALLLAIQVTLGIAVYGAVLVSFARPRIRQLIDMALQLRG